MERYDRGHSWHIMYGFAGLLSNLLLVVRFFSDEYHGYYTEVSRLKEVLVEHRNTGEVMS